ncbi:rplQ [Symbiodinium sp. CCMP2456]|nr:rplQ [Symbiodinium sp. CCMP2456]
MSYIPAGRPEGGLRDIWVSGKVGDSRARCLATSLHQKGHEVTLIGVKKSSEAPLASWGEAMESRQQSARCDVVSETGSAAFMPSCAWMEDPAVLLYIRHDVLLAANDVLALHGDREARAPRKRALNGISRKLGLKSAGAHSKPQAIVAGRSITDTTQPKGREEDKKAAVQDTSQGNVEEPYILEVLPCNEHSLIRIECQSPVSRCPCQIYHKVFGPSHKQWKMMKDMLNILVRDQKMETSLARAKELQQYAEEIVFLAKKNSPYHDGLVESMLTSPEARRILYERMLPRYQDRHFHFSRVLNQWRYRERDTTPMAIIE